MIFAVPKLSCYFFQALRFLQMQFHVLLHFQKGFFFSVFQKFRLVLRFINSASGKDHKNLKNHGINVSVSERFLMIVLVPNPYDQLKNFYISRIFGFFHPERWCMEGNHV